MSHADLDAARRARPRPRRRSRRRARATSSRAPSARRCSPRSPTYAAAPAPTPWSRPPPGCARRCMARGPRPGDRADAGRPLPADAPTPAPPTRRPRCGWPASPPRSPSSPESASGASAPGRTRPPRRSTPPGGHRHRGGRDRPHRPRQRRRRAARRAPCETDDTFTLRVSASELGDEPGVHEVWLINVDGKRMVALGVLASGDEGRVRTSRADLIDEGYRIVDISVEPDDGDPTHSG